MREGLVSVIMGIYNCESTLPSAIESILQQTYTNWELIMCDDGSSDRTFEVAQEYVEKYPDRIILVKNDSNSGLAYSLNHCLENASGEYVARMDGDDESRPSRFEKQVNYLKEHPDIQLVGTDIQLFDNEGPSGMMVGPEHPDKYCFKTKNPFMHATIMTYKYVYDKLGGYTVSERTRRSQDRELFFRFFHAGFQGANIKEPLYYGCDDMSAVKRRTFKVRWNSFMISRDGFLLLDLPKIWIVEAFVKMILKSIVPYKLIYYYRKKRRPK